MIWAFAAAGGGIVQAAEGPLTADVFRNKRNCRGHCAGYRLMTLRVSASNPDRFLPRKGCIS